MTMHQNPNAMSASATIAPLKARPRDRRERNQERLEFRLFVSAMVGVCLVAVAAHRVAWALSGRAAPAPRASVIQEARSAAYAVAGYAFSA